MRVVESSENLRRPWQIQDCDHRLHPGFAVADPDDEGGVPGIRLHGGTVRDFFISYTTDDAEWAEWLAWELERSGYSVVLQEWDFLPGGNFVSYMNRASAESRRTIAVLSPDYLNSLFAEPEWAAAFAGDPTGAARKLIPVRVRPCEFKGLLRQIVYIDLVGVPEGEARTRLLRGVSGGRAKPEAAPHYPNNEERSADGPRFPQHESSGDRAGGQRFFWTSTQPNICGRDSEISTFEKLLASLDSISEGRVACGAAVLIAGEAGVGKSALGHAACAMASARGFNVLTVACEPFQEGMTLFPLREIARRLCQGRTVSTEMESLYGPNSQEARAALVAEDNTASPGQRRDALVATFANLLLGHAKPPNGDPAIPLVLFFDDMEHMDLGTADGLLCVLSRMTEGPLMILGAFRADLIPPAGGETHPIRPLLAAVARGGDRHHQMSIRSLPREHLRRLVESLLNGPCDFPPSFYERLFRESEGNPLFLREILRSLCAPKEHEEGAAIYLQEGQWMVGSDAAEWSIPHSVEDAIEQRLKLLSAEQRDELEKAAVIGRRFAFDVISELSKRSEDELVSYLESFLAVDVIHEIHEGDSTFEFSHGKIRDVLYQSMSSIRRRKVHANVATILQTLRPAAGENWDAMIGEHLFRAGKCSEACGFLLRGAREAADLMAAPEAINAFSKALKAGLESEFPPEEDAYKTRYELAKALKLAGRTQEAKGYFVELSLPEASARIRGWSQNHLGDIFLREGDVLSALASYEIAEALAKQAKDSALLLETTADLVELYNRETERWSGVDSERAREADELYSEYLERQIELAAYSEDNDAKARAFRNSAKRFRVRGDVLEAINCYEKALALQRPGTASHRIIVPFAKCLRLVGRHREALEHVNRVLKWARQAGVARSEAIAHQYTGLILLEMVKLEAARADGESEALEHLQVALKMHNEIGFEQGRRETELILGEFYLHAGDMDKAMIHLQEALGSHRGIDELVTMAAAQLRANGENARAEALLLGAVDESNDQGLKISGDRPSCPSGTAVSPAVNHPPETTKETE